MRRDFDPRKPRLFRRIWRSTVAQDVHDEIQFHLDMRAADYVQRGEPADNAQAHARERLGDTHHVEEWLRHHDRQQQRARDRREWFAGLWQDMRHAMRQFRRAPTFTTVVIVTLAVAMGATTAVLSVVNGVLVQPLPFGNASRVVHVEGWDKRGEPDAISPLDLGDIRARNRSFAALASVQANRNANLTYHGLDPVRISEARVGAEFFAILGVRPLHGRFFGAGDDSAATGQVVVLSYGAWQRLFGGDSRVIGTAVRLDDRPFTIIGVAAPSLDFPAHSDLWIPAVWETWETTPDNRGLHELDVVGLLKSGVTLPAAQGDLTGIARVLSSEYPRSNTGVHWSLEALSRTVVGEVRTPLVALLGAVVFVLLIACANVANLLLVHGAARQGEFAVRISLGAARGRLVRQLLTESMLLWIAGAIGGICLSVALIHLAVTLSAGDLPRTENIHLSGVVFAVTAIATCCTGIAFGLIPALHTVGASLHRTLRRAGRGGERTAPRRTREALVLAEVALSLILLVGAGLLLRSFDRLLHVNPGFRSDSLVVFDVGTTASKYPRDIDTRRFTDGLRLQFARIPGTRDVAVAASRPLDRDGSFDLTTSFTVAGRPPVPPGDGPAARLLPVTAGYFRTMGIPIRRGRDFTRAEEGPEVPPVVVVNQALVRRFFPGEDPIGKRIAMGISHHVDASPADSFRAGGEIVGVVGDVKLDSLTDAPEPTAYVGYGTLPFTIAFVMRTTASLDAVAPAVRAMVRAADPDATVYGINTLRAAVGATTARPRFYTMLLSAFAFAALLIATLGIYGVISNSVTQQRRALGIRVALGAPRERIVFDVVRGGLVITVIGLAVGLLGSAAVTRLMASMLYQTSAVDPMVFAVATAVLLATAALAAWIPARRAAAVDPIAAMRSD